MHPPGGALPNPRGEIVTRFPTYRRSSFAQFALLLNLMLVMACDPSSGGAQGSDASPASRTACMAYVECVAEEAPQTLGIALAAYGSSGSCWSTQTEAFCEKACYTAARQVCGYCRDDSDCDRDSYHPTCDVAAHRCVSCFGTINACEGLRCTSESQCGSGGQCGSLSCDPGGPDNRCYQFGVGGGCLPLGQKRGTLVCAPSNQTTCGDYGIWADTCEINADCPAGYPYCTSFGNPVVRYCSWW